MLPVILALLPVVAVHPIDRHASICAVGEAALSDLLSIDGTHSTDEYIDARDQPGKPSVLTLCPHIAKALPARISIATPEALERVKEFMSHHPTVTIFYVEPPVLTADQRHATVRMGYSCTGLCGLSLDVEYVIANGRWVRGRTLREAVS